MSKIFALPKWLEELVEAFKLDPASVQLDIDNCIETHGWNEVYSSTGKIKITITGISKIMDRPELALERKR